MKEHNYALQKADKPRLRGSTQNICSVISISAVILKLTTDQNHIHFRLIQVLKNGMALHLVTFRSLSSKLEFSIYPPWSCSGVEEQMLFFSCQVKRLDGSKALKIQSPSQPSCSSERLLHVLNLVRPLTVLEKICHKENYESEQRTMHTLGKDFDTTELWRARASSETIDLRILEFRPD